MRPPPRASVRDQRQRALAQRLAGPARQGQPELGSLAGPAPRLQPAAVEVGVLERDRQARARCRRWSARGPGRPARTG